MAAAAAPRVTRGEVPYAGVATRAVAFAIDTVLSEGIFVLGAALLALAGSLVGELRPTWLVPIVAAAGWASAIGGYFVGFWTVTGQTPGMRLMHLRVVVARDGGPPHTGRAIVRLVGLGLSIVPFFAGFVPVLIDDRRRGLADFLAGTFVVYADRELLATELEPDLSPATSDMSGQPT
jgi:uncharacterized RDD family membrane protein YckC